MVDIARLASVPAVRGVSAAASAEVPDAERILELDSEWRGVEGTPRTLWAPLDNEASQFFREVVTDDPIYREILLSDRHGRLVAASGISSDYFQGDEACWRDVYDTGQLGVGDVVFDESARVFGLEMSTPVFGGESAGAMVGVMKAIVDVRELLAAVSGVPREDRVEAALVRRDGSIMFSRQSVDPETNYYVADFLREHLSSFRPGDPQAQASYRVRSSDGTDQMVAIAQTQLAASFPNLPRVVAVSVPEARLFEPVRHQARNLVIALALILWLSTGGRGPAT